MRKPAEQYMIEKGYVLPEHVRQAKELHEQLGVSIEVILMDEGWAEERDVWEAKAQERGLPFVDLRRQPIPRETLALVPAFRARQLQILPVRHEADRGVLWAAASRVPENSEIDDLRRETGASWRIVLAAPGALRDAIERHYGAE